VEAPTRWQHLQGRFIYLNHGAFPLFSPFPPPVRYLVGLGRSFGLLLPWAVLPARDGRGRQQETRVSTATLCLLLKSIGTLVIPSVLAWRVLGDVFQISTAAGNVE
jgi:hypothetical protein